MNSRVLQNIHMILGQYSQIIIFYPQSRSLTPGPKIELYKLLEIRTGTQHERSIERLRELSEEDFKFSKKKIFVSLTEPL